MIPIVIQVEPGAPVSRKDVNFIDYDGTVLYAYTIAEAQALSALPSAPSHDGLTFQEWNFTLMQINALTQKCDVGATYITNDGKTRLYIQVSTLGANVPLVFSQTVSEGVTVDWGDGSTTETFEGTYEEEGVILPTHQYTTGGDFVISLDVAEGCELTIGDVNNGAVVGGWSANYNIMISKAEIGARTNIGDYAFYSCYRLETVTLPSGGTSIGEWGFNSCYLLVCVIPPGSLTSIASGAFGNCPRLALVSPPSGVTSIGSGAYTFCCSPASITLQGGVTSIGDGAFQSCLSVGAYHILSITPPTLSSDVFGGISDDCIIYVPAASLAAYQAAAGWSDYASYMVGE